MRRLVAVLIPALLVLISDQLTKWWALRTLWPTRQTITLVPGWLELTPVENVGVAFGLFKGYGTLLALLVVLVLGFLALRNWREFMAAPVSTKIPVGVIAGGGVGNLIDRARLGFVADFIAIPNLRIFQVFNIADAAISVGGVLLVLVLWRADQQPRPAREPQVHETKQESQVDADVRG